jgi:hypothetical protein
LVDGTVTIDESLTVLMQILAEPSTCVSQLRGMAHIAA